LVDCTIHESRLIQAICTSFDGNIYKAAKYLRNLVLDTIEACRDGDPTALLGMDVLGLDFDEFDFKIDPVIIGPPHMKQIYKNTSVAFMSNTYNLYMASVTAIEKNMRPTLHSNATKKDIANHRKMMAHADKEGAYKLKSNMIPLSKLLKVICKENSLNQSKPLFSMVFNGILQVASQFKGGIINMQKGGYISDFKQNYNLKKMQAMIPRDFMGPSEAKEFMHSYQYYFEDEFFLQVNLIIP
jgi:hypothetical protein